MHTKLLFIFILLNVFVSFGAQAAESNDVFAYDGDSAQSVSKYIEEIEDDIQVEGYTKYCYTGNIDDVLKMLVSWNSYEYFYCNGCGGGYSMEQEPIIVGETLKVQTKSDVDSAAFNFDINKCE